MVFVAVYDIFGFVSAIVEYLCRISDLFATHANVPHIFLPVTVLIIFTFLFLAEYL